MEIDEMAQKYSCLKWDVKGIRTGFYCGVNFSSSSFEVADHLERLREPLEARFWRDAIDRLD